jgi:hypothetical protein
MLYVLRLRVLTAVDFALGLTAGFFARFAVAFGAFLAGVGVTFCAAAFMSASACSLAFAMSLAAFWAMD